MSCWLDFSVKNIENGQSFKKIVNFIRIFVYQHLNDQNNE